MRTSEFNFVENFIKVKKFNATINNLTIYSEDKDKNNSYKNIYIKRKINDDDFQIIFQKIELNLIQIIQLCYYMTVKQ